MAEAKKFAIVRFTEEYDAPGIIPLSWLAADNCTCYYPEAKTDQLRDRLIKDAVNPQNKAYKWQICKVHVMHLYSTFALARQNLKKAEETSDLDTEPDVSEERPRRKIKKTNFLLPGEEADDIAENRVTRRPTMQPQPSIVLPPFPETESFHAPVAGSSLFFPHSPFPSTDIFSDTPPVSSPSNPQSAQFVSAPQFTSYNPPVTHTLTDISKSYFTPSRQESSVKKSLHSSKISLSSAYSDSPTIAIPFDSAPSNRATLHPPIQEDLQHSSHSALAKEDRKWAAVLQWMSDISGRLEKIEEAIARRNVPIAEDNDTSICDLLPLKSVKDFEKLDDALKTSKSLKSKLISVLKSVGGKNAHALLCNMMRRLMEDHVAEVYNLSGTSTKNAGRRAFAGTQLCNSVLEACRAVYKEATDHDMRKNIGDWLNQAHTRIVRSCRPVPNSSP